MRKDNNKRDTIKKCVYALLFTTPLVIGVIGYLYAGENILDALYYGIGLYGFDFEDSETPIIGLEIARWTAPLVTATSVLVVAKSVFNYLHVCILALFRKDSNIVYGDSLYAKAFCDIEEKAVYSEKVPVRHGKNHYIMFASDVDNFSFVQNYAEHLKGKNIYLCLNEMDSTLLTARLSKDKTDQSLIKFFNPNDVIARSFWRERKLWNCSKKELKIAIVGFGSLGRRLLERALQLNLFATNQQIEYYIFGDCKRFEMTHSSMNLMNQDMVLYFEKDSEEQWQLFGTMDMIIVAEETDVDLMQSILGCSSSKTMIYYYSPSEDNISDYIATERLISYGHNSSVFTLDNIKTDKLYENAIALNEVYQKKYNSPAWEKLTGFVKESNISAADYGEIIKKLNEKEISENELAELEHCRWCRFHFLHYWRYGIPQNGNNKDEIEKIHQLLVPYNDLNANNKEKVKEVIRMWNGSIN